MGTNYDHHAKPPCESCGRAYPPRHIGKSSAGWCFGLHVYPEDGINTLADWEREWQRGEIFDEYGKVVSPQEMSSIVREREWPWPVAGRRQISVEHSPRWFTENHAIPGPNGLARHRAEPDRCIGHGEGTWDYCVGEFS